MARYSLVPWFKSKFGRSAVRSRGSRDRVRYRPSIEHLEERTVPSYTNPMYLFNSGGTLYFLASDETLGRELWKSDPATGNTSLVKDINPGAGGAWSETSDPPNFCDVNGTLFFTPGNYGNELWKSDGTASGTVLVKAGVTGIDNPTNVNGTLYFGGNDGQNGLELWKSDGTSSGTVMVKDINPGAGSSTPSRITNLNGALLFSVSVTPNYSELWKTDGTAAGTVNVAYFSELSKIWEWSIFNGSSYFTVLDGADQGLWKTNGTPAGTAVVKAFSVRPYEPTVVGSTLFLSANGLWKSDGTTSGTVLVKDLIAQGNLTNAGGTLYFAGKDSTYGMELWKSDGTANGTVRLSDLNEDPPPQGDSLPARLTYVAATNTLYFFAWVKNQSIHGENRLCSINTSTDAITVYDGQVDSGWMVYIPGQQGQNGYLCYAVWDDMLLTYQVVRRIL